MTVQLRSGVGSGQPNLPEDVALVQVLFARTPFGPVDVTGVYDESTQLSVAAMQYHHLDFSDGIVAPGDVTFHRLLGPPDTDPIQEARTDMLARAEVLWALSVTTEAGDVPSDFIRSTADGLGHCGQWLVDGFAIDIFSHPRWGTWELQSSIETTYRDLGQESSWLGLPISGNRLVPPGAVGWFENGRIVQHYDTGQVEVLATPPAPG